MKMNSKLESSGEFKFDSTKRSGQFPRVCRPKMTTMCKPFVILILVFSNGRLDETTDPEMKLKADGGIARRAQSLKRNKWLRDKYDIENGSTESLDTAKSRRNKNTEELADSTKNVKRSLSFGSKRHKNKDQSALNEAAERKNSKRLRESIRKKYNLPTRE
jgi:hypothetical protein